MTAHAAVIDRPEVATAPAGERLHALDALRGFALLCGVVLHAALAYLPGFGAWALRDQSTSTTVGVTFFVIHMFRMPAFFVIAGFFARLLVERRGVRGPWAAFVLSVPLALAFLSSTWRLWTGIPTPDQSLIPNLPAAVAFSVAFLVGWLLHRQAALLASIQRQWAVQLGLASALTVACLWIVGVTRSGETAAFDLRTAVYSMLYAAAGWAWTLALIGIALRFFAAESPTRRYVSDASYWIYLAHFPVLIVLQAVMRDLPFHWALKFPVQLVAAFAFLFATYHWLVRFTFVGEVLNGTRHPRSRAHGTPAHPAGGRGGHGAAARAVD